MSRSLEVAGVALALCVLAIGLALAPLQTPQFTRALSARYSTLPETVRAPFAEATRKFVVAGDSDAKRTIARVMPPDAVSHLDDVRGVLAAGNTATALLAALALAWVVVSIRGGRSRTVAAAFIAASAILGVTVGGSLLFALVDFDAFFAAFHSLFFSAGTWTFPAESLLIRLFPEAFWATAGLAWAVLVVALTVLYAVLGWWLRRQAAAERGVMHA